MEKNGKYPTPKQSWLIVILMLLLGGGLYYWNQHSSFDLPPYPPFPNNIYMNHPQSQQAAVDEWPSKVSDFHGNIYRDDNKILLWGLGSYSSTFYYFDSDKGELIETSHRQSHWDIVSKSGYLATVVNKWINDICNEYSGQAPGGYMIIEPVSGFVHGNIAGLGKAIYPLGFSSDDKEILFMVEELWTENKDCSKPTNKEYYKQKIGSSEAVSLGGEEVKLLKKWGLISEYR